MQIIIPMSGFGERFRKAGYKIPKPLIKIENKPLIAHVIDMFPGETDFHFICNEEHLLNEEFHMEETLRKFCPSGKIYGIKPHKLGPMHAVQQIKEFLDFEKETIVNYCDFTCYWNWDHFKNFIHENSFSGVIPAYKGFHPHSLGNTNYAYIREEDGWIKDIQEKKPYTNDRMNEYASSGTYYFSSCRLMYESFKYMLENNLKVGGEYYISLAYKFLFKECNSVVVYPLQHFMQWGTPEDVNEYNYWSKIFHSFLLNKKNEIFQNGATVIPMAGLGQRFKNEGYSDTKPLINISGLPMVVQSTRDLPKTDKHVFVIRSDMESYEKIKKELENNFDNSIIKSIDHVTDGQAITAIIGVSELENSSYKNISPLTIGVCDSGAIYDTEKFQELYDREDIDIIVWGIRGYTNAIRKPDMYGWIDADQDNLIKKISVKKPLDFPENDPIVLGIFTFKDLTTFKKVTDSLIERNGRINNEFYMDSCIEDALNHGLRCVLFEVDSFLCWGTPDDLRTFEYWQSCFHLWRSHPYRLEHDSRVEPSKLYEIEKSFLDSNPINHFSIGKNQNAK